jgi:hypothetical protein
MKKNHILMDGFYKSMITSFSVLYGTFSDLPLHLQLRPDSKLLGGVPVKRSK